MEYCVGQSAEFSKTISEYDVYGFAGITGDFNPVHINSEEANSCIFGKRVAHGMLVGAFISTVIGTQLPGRGTIYLQQNCKFIHPVYIGDTITARVEILSINEKMQATLYTEVKNQRGETVVTGEALVKLPDQGE